jgi:hypothetical protein
MRDSNPKVTFSYVVKALNQFDLAYIHLKDLEKGYTDYPFLEIFSNNLGADGTSE